MIDWWNPKLTLLRVVQMKRCDVALISTLVCVPQCFLFLPSLFHVHLQTTSNKILYPNPYHRDMKTTACLPWTLHSLITVCIKQKVPTVMRIPEFRTETTHSLPVHRNKNLHNTLWMLEWRQCRTKYASVSPSPSPPFWYVLHCIIPAQKGSFISHLLLSFLAFLMLLHWNTMWIKLKTSMYYIGQCITFLTNVSKQILTTVMNGLCIIHVRYHCKHYW